MDSDLLTGEAIVQHWTHCDIHGAIMRLMTWHIIMLEVAIIRQKAPLPVNKSVWDYGCKKRKLFMLQQKWGFISKYTYPAFCEPVPTVASDGWWVQIIV